MAMLGHITQRAISQLKPNGKVQWLWEKTARGSLGVKMTPGGTVYAAFQHGSPPHQKRESLGALTDAYTIMDARKQAQRIGEALYQGADPDAAVSASMLERYTVAQLAGRYLDSMAYKSKAELTRGVDLGRIKNHILPLIGNVPCARLTPDQCHQFFADIARGATTCDVKVGPGRRSIVKGGHGVARKCVMLLSAMWAWGVREGLVTVDDPAARIELGGEGEREISYSPDDYAAIIAAVTHLEGEREIKSNQADAVRLIMWTGARLGEIANARWCDYDRATACITLPPTAHKTGKKTGKPRVIALPAEAVAILDQMTATPGDLIFAGPGGYRVNLDKVILKMRTRPGVPADFILHGLRHSLASAMARAGHSAADIMFQLGHSKMQTSQGYIAAASGQRTAIANRASVALFEPLDKPRPALYVVPSPD